MNFSVVKKFFQRWLVNTFAVLVAVYLVPGISCPSNVDLLLASLLLGTLNALLRPVLLLLSLPLVIFTLGLFTLVINAGLLWLVGEFLKPGFRVDSFGAAFWGALVISIVALIVNSLTGSGRSHIHIHRGKAHREHHDKDDGDGPVIDV